MSENSVIVVGGGPAGLAIAGQLQSKGVPYRLLEKADQFVSSWRNHYDRLHLHTMKRYSNLPLREFPRNAPEYIAREQLVAYYDSYAQDFEITADFGVEVQEVTGTTGDWQVTAVDGRAWKSDQVVIATGYNCHPVIPQWKGMDQFGGPILHSSKFRNPLDSIGTAKRVLVVGMGNSGAEIALDLAEAGRTTYLSVRSPVNIVPRDFLGRGIQQTSFMLQKLPHFLANGLAPLVPRLIYGDISRYGLQKSSYTPLEQLKKFGKPPVIDVGTMKHIKTGGIAVKPGITHFEGNSLHFTDGAHLEVDAIVLATGYNTGLADLIPAIRPKLVDGQIRAMQYDDLEGLYFIGFDAFANGVLWSINRESIQIADLIARKYSAA